MRMAKAPLFLSLLFLCVAYAAAVQLSYEKGETFPAKFLSQVYSQGAGSADDQASQQTSSLSLAANLRFTVVSTDTKSFMFQMTTADVVISTFDGNAFIPVENDGSVEAAFANDFYFNINQSGEIEYVCVNENSTEVLNIKKGMVASLQTRLVDAGQPHVLAEVDAIGVHNSSFVTIVDNNRIIALKNYQTEDFDAFPDGSINLQEFKVRGSSRVELSTDGKFQTVSSSVTVQPFQTKVYATNADTNDLTASLSAGGVNTISFGESSMVDSTVTKLYSSFSAWLADHPHFARQPLTSSVQSGWKLNINHQKSKNNIPSDTDPDYPYNKDIPVDKMLGSTTVGLDFNADLFAGTNFDCEHDYFNYKLFGQAQAQVYLFGSPHNLLDVQFAYGRDNGTALNDAFTVTMWNKEVYNKAVPQLTDCQEHDFTLAHADPGFSVKHTVYVSIVPVDFAANGDANLGLTWGYNLCDAKLDAVAQIVPTIGVTVGGSAELSILIAKAGVNLNAGMTADLKPQLYLHGSKCLLGFDVLLDAEPFQTKMDGYYQTRSCHWFSCSWGDKHDKEFFSYSAPQFSNVNLFQQDFNIKDLFPQAISRK